MIDMNDHLIISLSPKRISIPNAKDRMFLKRIKVKAMMLKHRDDISHQNELMTRVASMYYLEDLTQEKIAGLLNLSRVKVGRLLKKALGEGIVEINVRPHPGLKIQLEMELVKRFSLKRALIAIDHPNPDAQRGEVARLVAHYIDDILRDGMIVSVGMGRNIGAVPDYVFNPRRRAVTFIGAMGGSQKAGEPFNPDHICRRLAQRFGGTSESLYAPAYVENRHIRDTCLQQEDIRQTLERARHAQIALVGRRYQSECQCCQHGMCIG